jgi:hypothetical protein
METPVKTVGVLALSLLALCAGATATPAASDGFERHSGTIVTIDRLRDVIIVEETGSWDPSREQARVTRNRIHVTGLTEFKVFVRSNIPGGYPGDFAEIQLDVIELSSGDTVTAECVRVGPALVALSIVVADVP